MNSKLLRNILMMSCSLITFHAAFANNYFVTFKTAAEEAKYCPAINDLKFYPMNPKDPSSSGWVKTKFGSTDFYSIESYPAPKDMSPNRMISNASYYKACTSPHNCTYGFEAPDNLYTVCNYSYPGLGNIQVSIELNSI